MIRVRQIKVDVRNDKLEELKKSVSKKLKINVDDIKGIEIKKKSLVFQVIAVIIQRGY